MKNNEPKTVVDGYYCPEIKSRWKSYGHYRLIMWGWMLNEITTVFSPTEISHNGFYAHAAMQVASVVLIGLPLVYSEICLGQYSNCDVFTMWDFFPLFRNVGYASCYIIFLKAIYILVLSAWHLLYIFYSAMDKPPWLSCSEFDDTKCMVKRINVSVFQHCLEAQFLFEEDCGIKTASNYFFEREIGNNCSLKPSECYRPWKVGVALSMVCLSVYILSMKREKRTQSILRFLAYYICIVILVLFCVALCNNGTWYATKITLKWSSYNFFSCFDTVSRGYLSVGAGTGMLAYLSRDVSFRSPATMTAITSCLFSLFVSFMFSLIAFTGIKAMSYYHGQEENVIEIGDSIFFPVFASMSEILIYFDFLFVPTLSWFSVSFLSLYVNFWIIYLFLSDILLESNQMTGRYGNCSNMITMIFIICCSLPYLCSDLTATLADATEIMQTVNSLLFSVSLYWIYGVRKHNDDITFMIGIKANYFWKLAWLLSPILLSGILYRAWIIINFRESDNSYFIESLQMPCDRLVLFIMLGIYGFIIVFGIFMQVLKYCVCHRLREIIYPVKSWGPKDRILSRSRKMFLPEIMTREFLYRQVRMRGYHRKQNCKNNKK